MEPMETSPSTSVPQADSLQPAAPLPLPPPSSISSIPEIPPPPSSSPPSLNPNPSSSQNPSENIQMSSPLQHPPLPNIQQSQLRPQLIRPLPSSSYSQFSPNLPSLPSSSSSSSLSSSSSTTTTTAVSSSSEAATTTTAAAASSSALSSSSSSSFSSSSASTLVSPFLSPAASPCASAASMQRGGLATGVPPNQTRLPTQQPSTFSSFGPTSFNQQYGGLARSSVNVPESMANQNASQVRPPIQGIQTIGMMGSLTSGTPIRPSGVPLHHQQRTVQPSLRSQSPSSNQSFATQKFRVPTTTSPSSPSPGTSQGLQSPSQPWMSSAPQVKQMPPPSLPSPSYRQQMRPLSLQQRPNHPQQHHHSLQMASHQQASSAQPQQQQLQTHHLQELYGQQYPQPRIPISVPRQQQAMRVPGPGNQKSSTPVTAHPSTVQSGGHTTMVSADDEESGNHILTKRSIRELVTQIGPSEKLDPEVEDFLILIAEDFVDSITTYGCSLAKHRKSSTLEAKDILLHLDRNWNMTLPGFGGEEIKSYKKPITNDVHKERLVAVRKSMQGSDVVSTKNTGGLAIGNAKGHSTKDKLHSDG